MVQVPNIVDAFQRAAPLHMRQRASLAPGFRLPGPWPPEDIAPLHGASNASCSSGSFDRAGFGLGPDFAPQIIGGISQRNGTSIVPFSNSAFDGTFGQGLAFNPPSVFPSMATPPANPFVKAESSAFEVGDKVTVLSAERERNSLRPCSQQGL